MRPRAGIVAQMPHAHAPVWLERLSTDHAQRARQAEKARPQTATAVMVGASATDTHSGSSNVGSGSGNPQPVVYNGEGLAMSAAGAVPQPRVAVPSSDDVIQMIEHQQRQLQLQLEHENLQQQHHQQRLRLQAWHHWWQQQIGPGQQQTSQAAPEASGQLPSSLETHQVHVRSRVRDVVAAQVRARVQARMDAHVEMQRVHGIAAQRLERQLQLADAFDGSWPHFTIGHQLGALSAESGGGGGGDASGGGGGEHASAFSTIPPRAATPVSVGCDNIDAVPSEDGTRAR